MLYSYMCNKCRKLEEKALKKEQAITVLTTQNTSHKDTINSQEIQISKLKEQLAWFRQQIFGQKSERFIDMPGENPILPGLEFSDEAVAEENTEGDKQHVEYDRNPKNRKKGSCTLVLPDDLPVKETVKDIPEDERIDPKTGENLVEIGRDTVDKLASSPGSCYIKRTVYVKYAVKNNPLSGIVQMSCEDSILTGSKFDESFMAEIVTEKLAYHMPFYRQQEKLACSGIKIERQTLSSLFVNLGQKLKPLHIEMKNAAFGYGYLFTDDTPARMLQPGKGKTKEVRMWIYEVANPNAPPYKVYAFSENHNYEHPLNFLKDFTGVIHADAFGAYVKIDRDIDTPIRWAACWAHGRRKFLEAEAGDQDFKNYILKMIRDLFNYEKVAWTKDAQDRLKIRNDLERPIVDAVFKKLWEKINSEILLPSQKLTKAIKYMLSYEKNFRLYLNDPNIRMENNAAERSVRKIVIGKKNWMFVGSPRAGESMAILYSFVQTCRALNINSREYLEDIFRRLNSHPHKNLRELLPDKWLEAKKQLAKIIV